MRVLGIETSCDETAAAVYDGTAGLLAHELYSQVALHATYGGVVPELASRDHLRKLLPLLEKTVDQSGGRAAIDGVAYTSGPGLVGALLVGAAVAAGMCDDHRMTGRGGGAGVEAQRLQVGHQPVGGAGAVGLERRVGRNRRNAQQVHQPVKRLGQGFVNTRKDGVEGHVSLSGLWVGEA